ncbi:MAG: FkbM family methyltransferase [Sulfolobales archaeon]
MTYAVALLRFTEILKLVFRDSLGYDFIDYLLRGRSRRLRNGLEFTHQSTLYHRLAHLYTKSSEFIVRQYLNRGDLSLPLKLLGLDGALFIDRHFCCMVKDTILCSPEVFSSELAYQVRQVFLKRVYGSPTNSLVIDIGAWVGDSSTYFAKLGNYVIAVEPLKEHVNYIYLNARLNNVIERVKVVNAAYPFTSSRRSHLEFRGPATIVPGGSGNINYVRLSDIINIKDRVYLKVDCEGCEYDLVNELIPRWVDVVHGIAMEIHKEFGDYSKLLNMLSKYYSLKYIAGDDYCMVVQLFRKI